MCGLGRSEVVLERMLIDERNKIRRENHVGKNFTQKPLRRYRSVLYRGSDPMASSISKHSDYRVGQTEDFGTPICIYYIRDESWTKPKPLTLDRPLMSQINVFNADAGHSINELHVCNPAPYPDGTPHFFEVIWQEATGMARMEFCPGREPIKENYKTANITDCRPFTSSSEQTEAIKQGARGDLFVLQLSFSIFTEKCPHAFSVISSTLSVVMAVLSWSHGTGLIIM